MQRREVAHRVEPQPHVVEMLEALAVSGRAAHVRRRDRVAARDEVLRQRREARREPRPPLRLRAAVHGDDDRERPVAFRLEEEHGNRLAVEALVPVQLRLDERSPDRRRAGSSSAASARARRGRRRTRRAARSAARSRTRAASRPPRTPDARRHRGPAAAPARAARPSRDRAARASSSRPRLRRRAGSSPPSSPTHSRSQRDSTTVAHARDATS